MRSTLVLRSLASTRALEAEYPEESRDVRLAHCARVKVSVKVHLNEVLL